MTESGEISVSELIRYGWTRIGEIGTEEWIRTACQVPGRLSLRQRFELIAEGIPAGFAPGAFAVPADVWARQIALFDEGDQALKANDPDAATVAFLKLKESHREGDFPAVLVEAGIGLGDAARQRDQIDDAIAQYSQAVSLARSCGYIHATVRGSIPLAYMHMRVGSSEQASLEFDMAYRMARDRGWRLDAANALTGIGDALQRLRYWDKAVGKLMEALSLFEALNSVEGIANAAVQLGEIHRRQRHVEEATQWYSKAVEAAERAGMVIAQANALDGLAEVELAAGDIAAARLHHRQSYDLSGQAYPRGQAHALNGLARCCLAAFGRADNSVPDEDRRRELEGAADYFAKALIGYLTIDDPVSVATSQTGLARCAELAGELETAVQFRLEAVASIESMRSSQAEHRHQDEYFHRFNRYYLEALRTAIQADDLNAFVTVFEAVAGRRLSNLITQNAPDADDAKALNMMMVDMSTKGWPVTLTDAGADERRRRIKQLGRLALRDVVTDMATKAFDDVMAVVYRPFDPNRAQELLESLELESRTILAVAILPTLKEMAWLWIDRDQPIHAGIHTLPPQTIEQIQRLRANGIQHSDRPADISALADLIPDELNALLPDGQRVTVVPAGLAWALPWPAVPVSNDRFFGERCVLSVCPSLTVLSHLGAATMIQPVPDTVGAWCAANVSSHGLRAFEGEPVDRVAVLSDAAEARLCLINAIMGMAVVISHGRPLQQLVHYLELDQETFVTPSDALAGQTPRLLALISCWGANAPLAGIGDPLTVATLALVRGSKSVAASTSELLDDTASAQFTSMFLAAALRMPFPEALHQATVRWLKNSHHRKGPLSRWAPLIALGT